MKQRNLLPFFLWVLSTPSGGFPGQHQRRKMPYGCGHEHGTGHFIEFDDPLQLKWRSNSLRAKGILHRQQGNHKAITVPAHFIVILIYINQGSEKVYRLKIYIREAVEVVNDIQPAHCCMDCNKAPTITPLRLNKEHAR